MIHLNPNKFLSHLNEELTEKGTFEEYKHLYYLLKIAIIPAVLILSAVFSFNFHFDFWSGYGFKYIDPQYLAAASTLAVSALIGKLCDTIRKEYLKRDKDGVKRSISEWKVIFTALLIAFNIVCDLKGVETIANKQHEAPQDTRTAKAEQSYQQQIKSLESQEKAVYSKYVAVKNRSKNLEFLRKAYIPKNGNKYHSKEEVANDLKLLEKIQGAYITAAETLNSQSEMAKSMYNVEFNDYENNLNAALLNFRFGAFLCSLVFVSCFWFICWVQYKHILENTNATTQATANTTPVYNAVAYAENHPETKKQKETVRKPAKETKAQETTQATTKETVNATDEETRHETSEYLKNTILKMVLDGATREEIVAKLDINKGTITKALQDHFFILCEDVHNEARVNEICDKLGLKPTFKRLEVAKRKK